MKYCVDLDRLLKPRQNNMVKLCGLSSVWVVRWDDVRRQKGKRLCMHWVRRGWVPGLWLTAASPESWGVPVIRRHGAPAESNIKGLHWLLLICQLPAVSTCLSPLPRRARDHTQRGGSGGEIDTREEESICVHFVCVMNCGLEEEKKGAGQGRLDRLLTVLRRAACPAKQTPQWRGRGGRASWW